MKYLLHPEVNTSGWFLPKITILCLHLSKLCQKYRGLFFSGHGV